MTPLLDIRDLAVRYGRITALDGVGLHVDAGEVVAIVGPNGAGKTTLLSAVAGIVRPVAGSIAFRGEPILGQPLERTVRRGIALVPEGRRVFGGLTVEENLRVGAVIRRDRAAAAAEIARFMEIFPILHERRNEPAGRLSGGEQQMLVIARAMLSDPALLMLDEPSLGLAPKVTDQVYALVADLRARGVTVLVVEQNADRALRAADRTYVLNAGRVRLAGPSAALRDDPAFEAAYFGMGDAA
ncbi:ABC transporter ATP-binding protein [Ruixingdingia sedimenti]|uniref:ABC transporter ATP-binding protein n=1 Tax=Ruixingdingia sedimenti TaxID=3073604 RepID=A0ABU1FCJ8_9RHOB|nr:ABC transporter ATP-binding protein [Xinfangfangia sp. LG-4]MDR5654590.1 ABC transporter ATP-binding protein [Xinfangfangia sp. LG-4]